MRMVDHRASEPVGVPALLDVAAQLYRGADPLQGVEASSAPMLEVSGGGRGTEAEYLLRIVLPLGDDASLDLARVGDELAVTVDGRRKLVALPSLLRRCVVTGAEMDETGLAVHFRPDPNLWMR
jgi:arsenite-transporting ATPase